MASNFTKSLDMCPAFQENGEMVQEKLSKDVNTNVEKERFGEGGGASASLRFDGCRCRIILDRLHDIDKKLNTLQNITSRIRIQTWRQTFTYRKHKSKRIPKKHRTVSTMTSEDKSTQISSMSLVDNRDTFKKNPRTGDVMTSDENMKNVTNENTKYEKIEEILSQFFKHQNIRKTDYKSVSTGTETLKMTEQTENFTSVRRMLEHLMPCKCRNKFQHVENTDEACVFPLYESSRNFDEFVQKELGSENQLQSNVSISGSNHRTASSFTQSHEISAVGVPHSMNMQLIRLASFRNFPSSHLLSTITLARCGFYFTDENDKVACFACKATYSGWQEGDNPEEIHQRISPNCPLVSGEQNCNVPIGNDNDLLQNNSENIPSNTTDLYQQQNDDEQQSRQISAASDHNSNENPNTGGEMGSNSVRNNDRQIRDDVTETSSSENTVSNQSTASIHHGSGSTAPIHHGSESTRAQQDRINEFIRQLDPLGISFDRPKYPTYAVLATRISSFTDWPSSLRQTPRDLATAGFLYAGYGDYTRCFYCGGGLRNWESDDDPWVEHARWFPKCVYVRQNKGDDFVALVQIEHQEQETREAAAGTGNLDIPPPNYNNATRLSTSENEARATNENRTVTHTSTATDILSFPSCQSVLEMGYSCGTVRLAFQEAQRTKDVEEIRGEDLMDIILLNEERGDDRSFMENNQASLSGIPQINLSSGPTDHSNGASESTEEACAQSMELLSRQLDNTTLEDTRSLIEENRQLKNQRRCKICLEEDASIAMLPCGHLCCCPECAPAMRKCPICRQFVKGTVKTWLV